MSDLIPDYVSDCRVIIKTKEEFNIDEYKKNAYEWIGNFRWDPEFSYLSYWDENSGVLTNHQFKKAMIDVVKLSDQTKVLNIEVEDGDITKFNVYNDNNEPLIEINGVIDYCGERCLYVLAGSKKIYDETEGYLKEEFKTEGYVKDCKEYKQIFTKYYSTGEKKYQKVLRRIFDETAESIEGGIGEVYSEEVLEDQFYKKDGSTIEFLGDYIFEDMHKYLIYALDKSTYGGEDLYLALLPEFPHKFSGDAIIYGSRNGGKDEYNATKRYSFHYSVIGDELSCYGLVKLNASSYYQRYLYGHNLEFSLKITQNHLGEVILEGWSSNRNFDLYNATLEKVDCKYDQYFYDKLKSWVD
jgi:hypothetical protein